ncbi:DUF6789 family protein [Bdellovibrio sp. HCB274]|uniref:DUF6789 family protein n=1 Tax=Bdellovibrio sp. HCB274 TaxID=3394361 RepID=UPI0039B6027A
MNLFLRGAWASVMATGSMTMMMFKSHKELPSSEKSPLPPAILTDDIQKKTGLFPNANSEIKEQATMLSHFGYGALGGITYAALSEKLPNTSPLLKGTLFGLGVWAASYYGVIPALNLTPKGREMTPNRKLMMAAAHVVWGASLGFAENELRKHDQELLNGRVNRRTRH